MKILITRVNSACLLVEKEIVSSINKGAVVFAGIENNDTALALESAARKIANLRIFENQAGKFHYSLKDKNYDILCVPNFTLCADTNGGRRPSFEQAMAPEGAKELFGRFICAFESLGLTVRSGIFGKHMDIKIELDGPVNIVLSGIENKKSL